MRTFYTAGTVGDSYIILCKLYPIAKKERILCRHYTSYAPARLVVKEIFSLLPNIQVELRTNRDWVVYVRGLFTHDTDKEEAKEYGLVPEYYPLFDSGDIKQFGLPAEYEVLQIEAGTDPAKRMSRLPEKTVSNIIMNVAYPLIVVGDKSFGMKGKNLIDLGGKTTVREVIAIIGNGRHFYGRLGFLSFVALSQKVPSSIEVPPPLQPTAQGSIYGSEEWKKFFIRYL
ncbi:hypothetical protein ES703_116559 [subsurface metagenome]